VLRSVIGGCCSVIAYRDKKVVCLCAFFRAPLQLSRYTDSVRGNDLSSGQPGRHRVGRTLRTTLRAPAVVDSTEIQRAGIMHLPAGVQRTASPPPAASGNLFVWGCVGNGAHNSRTPIKHTFSKECPSGDFQSDSAASNATILQHNV
jgi:hypothetical protein